MNEFEAATMGLTGSFVVPCAASSELGVSMPAIVNSGPPREI